VPVALPREKLKKYTRRDLVSVGRDPIFAMEPRTQVPTRSPLSNGKDGI